jgi:hypothetical protein
MPEGNGGNGGGSGGPPPGQSQDSAQGGADGGKPPELTFEAWLDQQEDAVKALYEQHTAGLRSALQNERASNKDLTKQLKDLSTQLEEGSEARTKLEQITKQLEAVQGQADFYEEAVSQGVADLRLAWLAVQAEPDEFIRRGHVDFERLKERHPNLFGKPPVTPQGHAGSGAGQQGAPTKDMNAFIRRSAGRET